RLRDLDGRDAHGPAARGTVVRGRRSRLEEVRGHRPRARPPGRGRSAHRRPRQSEEATRLVARGELREGRGGDGASRPRTAEGRNGDREHPGQGDLAVAGGRWSVARKDTDTGVLLFSGHWPLTTGHWRGYANPDHGDHRVRRRAPDRGAARRGRAHARR